MLGAWEADLCKVWYLVRQDIYRDNTTSYRWLVPDEGLEVCVERGFRGWE